MIKAAFLKKIGTTRAEFNTFVKSPSLLRQKTDFYNKVRHWCRGAQDQLDEQEDDDYYDDITGQSASCCGVYEIGCVENVPEKVIQVRFLDGLISSYRFFVYYSVTASATRAFKAIGFKQVDKFKNHKTGRTITVLTLKV